MFNCAKTFQHKTSPFSKHDPWSKITTLKWSLMNIYFNLFVDVRTADSARSFFSHTSDFWQHCFISPQDNISEIRRHIFLDMLVKIFLQNVKIKNFGWEIQLVWQNTLTQITNKPLCILDKWIYYNWSSSYVIKCLYPSSPNFLIKS